MYCSICHMGMERSWKYCPICGNAVSGVPAESDLRRTITFGELYEKWLEGYRSHISDATRYCYQAARKYFAAIEQYRFCGIDLEDLQNCLDQCPRGKRTRENMKALACLMYRYALPRHFSDQNYAMFLDTGHGSHIPRNAFTQQEVTKILESMDLVEYADEIAVLIYTGFRPCEMLELKKANFVQMDGIWCLKGGRKTIAGKDRIVTVSPRILPIIEARSRLSSDYLFPNRKGGMMSVKYFRKQHFYPALEAMGIQPVPKKGEKPRFKPYSCRHTFSDLIKCIPGADRDKAALMGHADYQTTRTMYQSSCIQAKKKITDQL